MAANIPGTAAGVAGPQAFCRLSAPGLGLPGLATLNCRTRRVHAGEPGICEGGRAVAPEPRGPGRTTLTLSNLCDYALDTP